MAPPPLRVLVVGQTPPPDHGQAAMIASLLAGRYERVELFHVRLAFSEAIEDVGRFSPRKVWVLLATIARIWLARFRHRTTVLYYPPSGPSLVPVLRDIALLGATRWLFRHTVFHFHAGGVSGFAPALPAPLRPLFHLAYRRPSLAIRTAPQNPEDGQRLGALRDVVVPNGIPDAGGDPAARPPAGGGAPVVLFAGLLLPGKGVRVLLEAFRAVRAAGVDARLDLMGQWHDEAFRLECERFVDEGGLGDRVRFLGVKRGREKWEHFAGCDVFCFPSHYEAETFGLVLLEAMQFGKPVVATSWRGIPAVVQDGVTGFTVPVRDPGAVADRLLRLLADPALRERMGREGRRRFQERFTEQRFHEAMERALLLVTDDR